MQTENLDDRNMVVDEPDEDEDSLFGSPPPSPNVGRSPSPALALPSASFSGIGLIAATQNNVGTIALPGSRHNIEHPINPLAYLPSSHHTPRELMTPRPPAYFLPHAASVVHPPGGGSGGGGESQTPSSSTCSTPSWTPSWSRASPVPVPIPKRSYNTKSAKSKSKSKESTPRPPPPPIVLPDPTDPPPANFLRNQSALLGHAGLVGGIKPSQLSVTRHIRGTTKHNPIVVEDEEETPTLGLGGKFRHPYIYTVDPDRLPHPPIQEVAKVLAGQKDIFAVLYSIKSLLAKTAQEPKSSTPFSSFRQPAWAGGFQRQQSPEQSAQAQQQHQPPPKKRKLNRVPAGAADWDVPYPFPEGEGPEMYRTTWERERLNQLIEQFKTLVRTARRKAAMRIYVQGEEARQAGLQMAQRAHATSSSGAGTGQPRVEVKVHGHYRLGTVTYGLEGEAAVSAEAQVQEVLMDASNMVMRKSMGWEAHTSYEAAAAAAAPPAAHFSGATKAASASAPQPSTPFDQLITSLLAASPQQGGGSAASVTAPTFPSNLVGASTSSPMPPVVADPSTSSTSTTDVHIASAADSTRHGDPAMDDPGLFDSWMHILDTFPMPSEGFNEMQALNTLTTSTSGLASVSADGTFDVDSLMDFELERFSPTASVSQSEPQTGASGEGSSTTVDTDALLAAINTATAGHASYHTPVPDSVIEPSLLAISVPQPLKHNAVAALNGRGSQPPSSAPSPMPSMSSFGDAGPATPSSATWDHSLPEIASGSVAGEDGISFMGYGQRGEGGQGMLRRAILNTVLRTQQVLDGHLKGSGGDDSGGVGYVGKGKGKAREEFNTLPSHGTMTLPPGLPSIFTLDPAALATTAPSVASSLRMLAPEKVLDRAEILKRAGERRMELKKELDKVRIQLWETTIEHGALMHVAKHYSKS